MPTVDSVTFQTDKDSLFAAAIQTVKRAGYVITKTDNAARKFHYYADAPFRLGYGSRRCEVTIEVSEATQAGAQMTIKAVDLLISPKGDSLAGAFYKENVEFEGQLVDFVLNELKKQYQVVNATTATSNAPGVGATGRLVTKSEEKTNWAFWIFVILFCVFILPIIFASC